MAAEAAEVFVYMGEGGPEIPDDVVRVRIHPSVSRIPANTFRGCNKLEDVELCDGLLEIGTYAFYNCMVLKRISIPSTVTTIGAEAFSGCYELEEVDLCEGLIEIGMCAFLVSSLKQITSYSYHRHSY